jgi:hypothetical protein
MEADRGRRLRSHIEFVERSPQLPPRCGSEEFDHVLSGYSVVKPTQVANDRYRNARLRYCSAGINFGIVRRRAENVEIKNGLESTEDC